MSTKLAELHKLASDMPAVLLEGADIMAKLASRNAELTAANQALEHSLACVKVARRLEERGLSPELSFDAKVAALEGMPKAKLASLEAGIELVTGNFSLGAVREPEEKLASQGNIDPLDAYILGNASYEG